eukprot:CAMPEP_0206538984 /NCGR_PEP_ID=MMETSP0325_2-20121206/8183_1 /ASSEMBLY_ACC=CAM_ASM_000347 /TAXON_ID=2866 /ORGANISM="Crypthecodinium cohnii, Strain Seligo" /LENGTH=151 /DNA_ID=CAMNT_0054036517 /DNA_START=73 /DNA_END=528 /DNA_ORIENTATION=-
MAKHLCLSSSSTSSSSSSFPVCRVPMLSSKSTTKPCSRVLYAKRAPPSRACMSTQRGVGKGQEAARPGWSRCRGKRMRWLDLFCFALFFEAGANANATKHDGWSPLHLARADVNARNNDGRTPRSLVCCDWESDQEKRNAIDIVLKAAGAE